MPPLRQPRKRSARPLDDGSSYRLLRDKKLRPPAAKASTPSSTNSRGRSRSEPPFFEIDFIIVSPRFGSAEYSRRILSFRDRVQSRSRSVRRARRALAACGLLNDQGPGFRSLFSGSSAGCVGAICRIPQPGNDEEMRCGCRSRRRCRLRGSDATTKRGELLQESHPFRRTLARGLRERGACAQYEAVGYGSKDTGRLRCCAAATLSRSTHGGNS
jgi:hypothetical protein